MKLLTQLPFVELTHDQSSNYYLKPIPDNIGGINNRTMGKNKYLYLFPLTILLNCLLKYKDDYRLS